MSRDQEQVLQNPESRPTLKQVESWLKDTDKAMGFSEDSMAGLVFMLKEPQSVTYQAEDIF